MDAKRDRSPDTLITLARKIFGNLSVAETLVVSAAESGECITCDEAIEKSPKYLRPDIDEAFSKDFDVRPGLIRWLCLSDEATQRVAPRGIQVLNARVTGDLDLNGATVSSPLTFAYCRLGVIDVQHSNLSRLALAGCAFDSLKADGAQIKSTLNLQALFSANNVRLTGATIGGSLDVSRAQFQTVKGEFNADRIEVKGDVKLSGVVSNIDIQMMGAHIGGDLVAIGATLADLSLQVTRVTGGFAWRSVQRCTHLSLVRTSVGSLVDDVESWKNTQAFDLDGFVYDNWINSPTLNDAESRLSWLRRQTGFSPKSYQQLAKVLRDMGDNDGATKVLFELESRARADQRTKLMHENPLWWPIDCAGDGISWATIGYGIYPRRAIAESVVLAGLGWIIFRRAHQVGAMIPTDEKVAEEFIKSKRLSHYEPFSPAVYTIENCVPLVKFGQDELWRPNPAFTIKVPKATSWWSKLDGFVTSPKTLRRLRWSLIALGWLLATFFVAGLTGLIKIR